MLKAAVYCRISKDAEEKGLGVERQRQDCVALAERKGWKVVQVFTDNDISAARSARGLNLRPAYDAMVAAVKAGRINAVIAWDLDRLSRDPWQLEQFWLDCIAARVKAVATLADEVNIETRDGLLTARIKAAVAAEEVDKLKKRVTRKMQQLAETGKFTGGVRRYGYEQDGVTLNETEAELLAEAARRVLRGETVYAVCRDFDVRGVRNDRGNPWRPAHLAKILTGPRIAGLSSYKGKILGKAEWPAIIDRKTWDALRDRLAPRAEPRSRTLKYLLSGYARCGKCTNGRLYAAEDRGRLKYTCEPAVQGGCRGVTVSAEPLERYVFERLVVELRGGALERSLQRLAAGDPGAARVELSDAQQRLEELATMWAEGEIDTASYRAARDRLDARVEAASSALAAGETQLEIPRDVDALIDAWTEMTVHEKRVILDTFIVDITVMPVQQRNRAPVFDGKERVNINWRF